MWAHVSRFLLHIPRCGEESSGKPTSFSRHFVATASAAVAVAPQPFESALTAAAVYTDAVAQRVSSFPGVSFSSLGKFGPLQVERDSEDRQDPGSGAYLFALPLGFSLTTLGVAEVT